MAVVLEDITIPIAVPAFLTSNEILTLALSKQHDTSSALRAKALSWLNEAIQRLTIEREWLFLEQVTTLPINDNTILLPGNFGTVRTIQGDDFFFVESHRLTDREAYEQSGDETTPVGFTETATNIIFHPGATGNVDLCYKIRLPEYADNQMTVIPKKFKNLLARAVLSMIYEYEENQRGIPSLTFDVVELSRLKAEENRDKPKSKRSKYIRGRI